MGTTNDPEVPVTLGSPRLFFAYHVLCLSCSLPLSPQANRGARGLTSKVNSELRDPQPARKWQVKSR